MIIKVTTEREHLQSELSLSKVLMIYGFRFNITASSVGLLNKQIKSMLITGLFKFNTP